ncbi:hypothetical protein, partial [Xanthovirga aplysinae]|uniref:hypothetical protein n=1 Tax=Xanthovirga aplysinae TaxID=2529853 RepID=UPI0012BB6DF2
MGGKINWPSSMIQDDSEYPLFLGHGILYANSKDTVFSDKYKDQDYLPLICVYTNQGDSLLKLKPKKLDRLNFQKLIKSTLGYFVYYSEYDPGSGNLNFKHFYHLDTVTLKMDKVTIVESLDVYRDSLNLGRDVFTRKGEEFVIEK